MGSSRRVHRYHRQKSVSAGVRAYSIPVDIPILQFIQYRFRCQRSKTVDREWVKDEGMKKGCTKKSAEPQIKVESFSEPIRVGRNPILSILMV